MKPQGFLERFGFLKSDGVPEKGRRWITWLSGFLAILFLYLALRELDWKLFGETLQKARYSYLPPIFLWGSLTYWVRSLRWRILLESRVKLSIRDVFWANMSGYFGNTVLPARAGELIRAGYISVQNEQSASFVFATGMVERLMDVVSLVILGSIALASANILSPMLQVGITSMAVFGALGLAVLYFLPRFETVMGRIILALPMLGEKFKQRIIGSSEQFIKGLQSISNRARLARFILYTLVVWFMDALGMVFLSKALSIHIQLREAFILLAGLGLSSAVPSTPGYIGVYQYISVIVLNPFGYQSAEAVALVLFSQTINILMIVLWGGLAIWRFRR